MSNIIPTPSQAQLVEGMPVIDGQATSSVKTAVTTPEGLYAVAIKPLLDHHYNALHMQILTSLALPFDAFQSGYVLLNGTILKKSNFPKWQKLIQYRLATEVDDAIQLLDMTSLYLRPKLVSNGTIEAESLPNITASMYIRGADDDAKATGAIEIVWSTPPYANQHSGIRTKAPTFYLDAARSSPAYGRRNEVAPTSLLVYHYAYVGEYRGTTPMRTTYYLIDSDGMYLGQTIELAGDIGYAPIHMTTTPPPATRKSNFLLEGDDSDDIALWRYVDGQWRRATR